MLIEDGKQAVDEGPADRFIERMPDLAIDAQYLVRMPILGPAEITFLDRRRPAGIGNQAMRRDAGLLQGQSHLLPGFVIADDAGHRNLCFQASQHVGDVGSPAEPRFLLFFAQEDDGRFLADAFRVAENVTVENQIAEDENVRMTEILDNLDKLVRHHNLAIPGNRVS